MEVQPGIHLVTDRIDATTLTVTLIGERAGLIVDTGLPGTPAAVILPYLASLGRAPGWLQTIVNTHCHGDHRGGNGALLAVSAARALLPPSQLAHPAHPPAFLAV